MHDVIEQVILETTYRQEGDWEYLEWEGKSSLIMEGKSSLINLMAFYKAVIFLMDMEREVDCVLLHFGKMSNCPPPDIPVKTGVVGRQ